MKKKALAAILTCALVSSVFVGCGSSSTSSSNDKITLTVLSQKTDFVNTKFKDYAKEYSKIHPNIILKFEAYTDYDNQTKTRMSSSNYGDVLMIPSTIKEKEYPNYFASLGNEKDYTSKYYGMEGTGDAFGGKVYGIPSEMNVSGMVYNKAVFKQAGITKIPTSEDEFLADMKLIKAKTSAIPYYTNYKDGWPLQQWEPDTLSVSGKNTYTNQEMVNTDSPFSPGTPHYIVYKLMYDLAKNKVIEQDPTTTDWEKSKTMMGQGKIGVMDLGSFAITQIQTQATNKDDIAYMPFPYQVNGKSYTNLSADDKYGINKNSKHVQECKDLITWFVEKSSFPTDNGTVSTLKSAPLPKDLQSFKDMGVQFLMPAAAKKGQAAWFDSINKAGSVGLWTSDFGQKIVDAGLGNSNQTFDQVMDGYNAKWKAGRDQVKSGN